MDVELYFVFWQEKSRVFGETGSRFAHFLVKCIAWAPESATAAINEACLESGSKSNIGSSSLIGK